MADRSRIEWLGGGATWNPVTGCTKVSPACAHCYAERMAKRLAGRCGYPADHPFRVTLHPERLEEPLRWRKPRRVFVCSMSDLFHEEVPVNFLEQVWRVMLSAQQHTFLVLTKRPQIMAERIRHVFARIYGDYEMAHHHVPSRIWLGVTAEDQQRADERIPLLLQTPAAVRWVSVEPMLGPVDLRPWLMAETAKVRPALDWVVCGGETGAGARPTDPRWIENLRDQCQSRGVPFFLKSWGDWVPWYGDEDAGCPCGRGCEEHCDRVHFWGFSGSGGPRGYEPRGIVCSVRVGKRRAGRGLDGGAHNEFPELSSVKGF